MSNDALPESDCLDGAPHPREAAQIFGHADCEAAFLSAFNAGRLPHGWLLTGPKGVGKATFAWRLARFLLATPPMDGEVGLFGAPSPPDSLDIDPEHPVARRLRALSEPGLLLLRRPWDTENKRLKTELTVDEARKIKGFFQMSAGAERRVVIVDSADDLNTSAANALLKELEEPPENAVLLLISHRPSGLLPTIRSRCRTLRFGGLNDQDLAAALVQAQCEIPAGAGLAQLAQGSAGAAIQLTSQGGMDVYGDLLAVLRSLPNLDRALALKLANSTTGKAGEPRFELILTLLDQALARAARLGVTGQHAPEILPGEAGTLVHIAPDPAAARACAELTETLTAKARRGNAVNLDPAALIFETFLDLSRAAARLDAKAI